MNIKETAQEIHANNVAKGFWETERNIGEMLMLVVSELSEALEADRKNRYSPNDKPIADPNNSVVSSMYPSENGKTFFEVFIKDTFEDEIADAVIRLFDLAEGKGIDLEWHIAAKMRYNKTRPYKHNKEY